MNMITKTDDFIKRVESTAEEDFFTPRIFYHLSSSMFHEMCDLLKEQEAVVLCKDCQWWHESETHKGYGDCGQANGITLKSSDWYCADGKRRTDDA